jgi:cytochrome c oxidase subunit 1
MFLWSIAATSQIIVVVMPVLAACITMLLCDRSLNTVFYDVSSGSDVLLYQHLFWVFGHPEVYIIILPVFGLVSHTITSNTSGSLFNSLGMCYAMGSICIVGFFVWAHHMFTSGLDIDARMYFTCITITIALPTAIKVFSWLTTLLRWCHSNTIAQLVCVFIIMFTIGGCTGIILGNSELDLVLHDSYFVVGHFHYVLSLGASLGLLSCLVACYQALFGVSSDDYPIRIACGLLLLATNVLFWPMHIYGLLGYPRRISDYPDQFISYSATCYAGCAIVLLAILVLTICIMLSGMCVVSCRVSCWSWQDMCSLPTTSSSFANGFCTDGLMRDYTICHCYSVELVGSGHSCLT